MKYVIDCTTGEEIVREMTKTELAEEAASAQAYAETTAEIEIAKAAIEAKKQEVLAKLGLTADEVAALLA